MKVNSLNQLVETFEKFNALYFNEALDVPTFKFTKSTKYIARFCVNRKSGFEKYSIEFNSNVEYVSETFFEQTMIHEMIHYFLYMCCGDMSHGKFFKHEAKNILIKSNGKYNVERTISSAYCKITSEKKEEVVFILIGEKENKMYYNVVRNPETINENINVINRFNFNCYRYTGSKFNDVSSMRFRKHIRMYPLDKETLNEIKENLDKMF